MKRKVIRSCAQLGLSKRQLDSTEHSPLGQNVKRSQRRVNENYNRTVKVATLHY